MDMDYIIEYMDEALESSGSVRSHCDSFIHTTIIFTGYITAIWLCVRLSFVLSAYMAVERRLLVLWYNSRHVGIWYFHE